MSVEHSVRVRDEVDEQLEQIRDEEIKTALVQTLEDLAERDETIQQQQDGLHDRMGISTDEEDAEELTRIYIFGNSPRLGDRGLAIYLSVWITRSWCSRSVCVPSSSDRSKVEPRHRLECYSPSVILFFRSLERSIHRC